jgi:hypothetical protein
MFLRNPKVVRPVALIAALILATVAEQFTERLWVTKIPGGNEYEFYHGPLTYPSLVIVFITVAVVVFKITSRMLTRGRNGR